MKRYFAAVAVLFAFFVLIGLQMFNYFSISTTFGCNSDRNVQNYVVLVENNHARPPLTAIKYWNSTAITSWKPTTTRRREKYVTVEFPGRLGNHMFQVAGLIGIANRTNRIAVVDAHNYAQLVQKFPNLAQFISIRPPRIVFKRIRQATGDCCHFDQSLIARMKSELNYVICGYLQSWRYFTNVDIVKAFTFNNNITERARRRISDALDTRKVSRNRVELIGVHNRRGDAVTGTNYRNHSTLARKAK